MHAPQAVRVTTSTANDQLLYFTSSSLSADDRTLVFISDRSGDVNLFRRDLVTGAEHQLTRNTESYLKSYVYFDGVPFRGLGRASISFDSRRQILYYIQGRQIRAVAMDGTERTLCELPDDQVTAFSHVSDDGKLLCIPTTDAAALSADVLAQGNLGVTIDKTVREKNLSSYLRIIDTATGQELACERVRQGWVTHVQFSPTNPRLLLFNHEWPTDCGVRRIWLWDGHSQRQLRTTVDGRHKDDWVCHEMWERDGSALIYHGGYVNGPMFVGRMRADGSEITELPFPEHYKPYGHFTSGRPGVLITDGYYVAPDQANRGASLWLTLLRVDWKSRTIDWRPLLHHGSSWKSQDAHPHPIFDHAGDRVYYTSDVDGQRAVYRVDVAALQK